MSRSAPPSLFVQTRGRPRHRDYDFLGTAPERPWWRDYAGHTAFERPTVLVESDGAGHRLYLSGVPSARRDAVGSVIRYTLVLDGTGAADPVAVDPDGLVGLVACWLADQDRTDQDRAGPGTVAAALDAALPEDEVERMLADPRDDADRRAVAHRVQDRVRTAVAALPAPAPPASPAPALPVDPAPPPTARPVGLLAGVPDGDPADPPDRPGADRPGADRPGADRPGADRPGADGLGPDWLGDVADPAARAAFLSRVRELVAGRPGCAVLLNLVGSAADLDPLLARSPSLAVLAPDVGGAGATALHRPGAPGKALPSAIPATARTADRWAGREPAARGSAGQEPMSRWPERPVGERPLLPVLPRGLSSMALLIALLVVIGLPLLLMLPGILLLLNR